MSDVPLSPSYRTLATSVHVEFTEKKSRFLCALLPVSTEAQIQALLEEIRKQYWDAAHHCTAYRLKDGSERAHDDGEPAGTAGRPMLYVLQQHQLQDILAVVTRYFGGTLLGAGGLVRAYRHAVELAVEQAQDVEIAPHDCYQLAIEYAQYDHALHILTEAGWNVQPEFTEQVTLTIIVPTVLRAEASTVLAGIAKNDRAAMPISTDMRPLTVRLA